MKELADFTLEINQKYEKRLVAIRVAKKLQASGLSNLLIENVII